MNERPGMVARGFNSHAGHASKTGQRWENTMSFRLRVGNHECEQCSKGFRGDFDMVTHYTEDEENDPRGVADCVAGIAPCVQHACYYAKPQASRTSESEFRANVPQYLGPFEILEVRNYRAGDDVQYASAQAIVKVRDDEWSVHTVIHQADRIGYVSEWLLDGGHYFPTRAGAQAYIAVNT